MSLIAISPIHSQQFWMKAPLRNTPVGLIVPDHRRDQFRNWADIRSMAGLRVAIVDDRSSLTALENLLPNAMPVPFPKKEDVDEILAAGAPDIDAIAMFAEEAAA